MIAVTIAAAYGSHILLDLLGKDTGIQSWPRVRAEVRRRYNEGTWRDAGRWPLEDVEYRDVLFPQGTLVFACAHTANRDPAGYDAPEAFEFVSPPSAVFIGGGLTTPGLLDACFQAIEAHPKVRALGEGALGLPIGVRRLHSHRAARNAHYCYTRVTKADASGIEADMDVLDEHGAVLLSVEGLRLSAGAADRSKRAGSKVVRTSLVSFTGRYSE